MNAAVLDSVNPVTTVEAAASAGQPAHPNQTQQLEEILVRLDEAWAQLLRRVAAEVKEYPYALPLAQVTLLRLLDRLGAQRMTDLATHLNVTQSGCTALVDRAIQADLVERYRDRDDRRVVWVGLTATGNAALAELRRIRARYLAKHLQHLDMAELDQLATLLSRTTEALAQSGADDPGSP
ncbi:MAG: MarR family winged helix-turn-helix transcriptional regulator [Caldilineaceae bacterium]